MIPFLRRRLVLDGRKLPYNPQAVSGSLPFQVASNGVSPKAT
ncbi:hypothetical protein [Eikenella halliae]